MVLMVGRDTASLKKVCFDRYSLTFLAYLTLYSAKLINYLKQNGVNFFNQVVIFKDKLLN